MNESPTASGLKASANTYQLLLLSLHFVSLNGPLHELVAVQFGPTAAPFLKRSE